MRRRGRAGSPGRTRRPSSSARRTRSRARRATAPRSIGNVVPASAALPSGMHVRGRRARAASRATSRVSIQKYASRWWRSSTGCAFCRCVYPGITAPRCSSARCSSVPRSASDASTRRSDARPWRTCACRVATWSLRERAVCSRAPASPMREVSSRSTAMCTSSSAGSQANAPAADVLGDAAEPRLDRVGVGVADDALRASIRGVRDRAGDVLLPQAHVDRQRRPEVAGERVHASGNRPPHGVCALLTRPPPARPTSRASCPPWPRRRGVPASRTTPLRRPIPGTGRAELGHRP